MLDIQGFPVIGDDFVHAPNQGRGYEGRDYSKYPLAGLKCAKRASIQLIDPKEFPDRIAQKTKERSWVTDICDDCGVTVKDQQNSNYCWIHAPTHGMEVYYALSNNALKAPLSAFYAGALIKGGRNQGGSGVEGVQWLSENGTCTEALHSSMDFSTRNSADVVANAALHKITEYEEIDADNSMLMYQTIISGLLADIPWTVGIPAWSHEILLTFLRWDPANYSWLFGGVAPGGDNSWGLSYGTRGRFILSRTYCRFDEVSSIRGCTPSLA